LSHIARRTSHNTFVPRPSKKIAPHPRSRRPRTLGNNGRTTRSSSLVVSEWSCKISGTECSFNRSLMLGLLAIMMVLVAAVGDEIYGADSNAAGRASKRL
jgi:hypothetical protein